MLVKLRGIVLKMICHSDRNDIVTLFTEQRGRIALLVPGGNSKGARMRRARLSPLALVETEINFKETRDLQFIGEITTPHVWRNIYFDPMKSSLAIFMAEFLNRLLRTREADSMMWRYLLYSINSLDKGTQGLSNFHLAFLIRMLPFAGIEPDMDSFEKQRYFDLQAGEFTDLPPVKHRNYLSPEEAETVPVLIRMNFRNMHHFKLNVAQRRQILDTLIKYYSTHLPIGERMHSLDVLREVFS